MKRILLPTDFSELTYNSLEYAAYLAKHSGAKLFLVNAFDLDYFHPAMPSQSYTMRNDESRQKLKKLKEDIQQKEEYKGLDIGVFAAYSEAISGIEEIVKEFDIDLIVMATKGVSGLKKIFTDSHTKKVIDGVSCPVLVIPNHKDFQPVKSILFATDYTDVPEQDLSIMEGIAESIGAKVKIVHVNKDGEESAGITDAKEAIKKNYFNNVSHEFALIENDNVLEGIEEYRDNDPEIGMLVMVAHERRDWLERFTSPSLTKKVIHHPHLPTLIIKN